MHISHKDFPLPSTCRQARMDCSLESCNCGDQRIGCRLHQDPVSGWHWHATAPATLVSAVCVHGACWRRAGSASQWGLLCCMGADVQLGMRDVRSHHIVRVQCNCTMVKMMARRSSVWIDHLGKYYRVAASNVSSHMDALYYYSTVSLYKKMWFWVWIGSKFLNFNWIYPKYYQYL